MSYFIHWINWNSKWDEWIDDDLRLSKGCKDNEICRQLLNKMNENIYDNKENINMSLMSDISNMSDDYYSEHPSDIDYRLDKIKLLPLPKEIQFSLYQQYKLIQSKPILLIYLPKSKGLCINGIIDKFIKYQSMKINDQSNLNPFQEKTYLNQVMNGIKYYFNQLIN